MFCKHKWDLLSETTTKSKYQHTLELNSSVGIVGKARIPWQLCDAERKVIQVFTCSKCGKLKRFVEKI